VTVLPINALVFHPVKAILVICWLLRIRKFAYDLIMSVNTLYPKNMLNITLENESDDSDFSIQDIDVSDDLETDEEYEIFSSIRRALRGELLD
jgi:hypothetical protein